MAVKANIKVQELFNKNISVLKLNEYNNLSEFQMNEILGAMQKAYDLGHADGVAEHVLEEIYEKLERNDLYALEEQYPEF